MKNVYIVLIKAHTGLGAVARQVTGYGYTHVALSLNGSLSDFISFSRRRHYLPFDAGFTHEKRDYYAFGKYNDFGAKVFRISVVEKRYAELLRFIDKCENDDELMFNLFSMATMPILHGFQIYKTFNCMSFTAKALEICGIKLEKPYYRYSIKDIDILLEKYTIFEGNIMRKPSLRYNEYMTKYPLLHQIKCGTALISTLTNRLLLGGEAEWK